jgi:hypothetical protein
MRRLFQWLLRKPVTWLALKLSSSPNKNDIFSSLDKLLADIRNGKESSGCIIPFDIDSGKFVVVSDQHKGGRDLADDFRLAEKNYLTALQHYYNNEFTLISNGDCEELWENTPASVIDKNRLVLLEEARFLQVGRYHRLFGNHDLEWKYDVPRNFFLKPIFGDKLKVCEGLLLETKSGGKTYSIFFAHGHQGDKKSDGNPFSTWVVAAIWTPIQRFLEITINTTADSFDLVDKHNILMYEWSATQKDLVFISGHTHKPVFASLDHIDRLHKQLKKAVEQHNDELAGLLQKELERRQAEYAGKVFHKTMAIPSYFNTGCCCFSDGDITAIEIDGDAIRLVKWQEEEGKTIRVVLEDVPLSYILEQIGNGVDAA